MPDYGIKMSKSGSDAERSAEENLTFNSEWEKLQIVQKGSIFIPDSGVYPGVSSVNVAHNLGYVPHFMIWYKGPDSADKWWHNTGDSYQQVSGKADTVNLTIMNRAIRVTASFSVTAHYVIFKEKIK